MSLQKYLEESGSGPYSQFRVPDLVPPSGTTPDLTVVLESPHIDELKAGRPVEGRAGKSALQYLLGPNHKNESLGSFIANKHKNKDFRVAILNVSQMPLQIEAFVGLNLPPDLSSADWETLHAIQRSRSHKVQVAQRLLLPGFEQRLDQLNLTSTSKVFLAGMFVLRSWRAMSYQPALNALPIPHPSRQGWRKATTNQYKGIKPEARRKEHEKNLKELSARFIACSK